MFKKLICRHLSRQAPLSLVKSVTFPSILTCSDQIKSILLLGILMGLRLLLSELYSSLTLFVLVFYVHLNMALNKCRKESKKMLMVSFVTYQLTNATKVTEIQRGINDQMQHAFTMLLLYRTQHP